MPKTRRAMQLRQRRPWLITAVAALAAPRVWAVTHSRPSTQDPHAMLDDSMLAADPPRLDPVPPIPAAPAPGRPGDFGFLDGRWHIRHLKRRGDAWDRFEGEARCWSILDGVGSVEELLIPARQFSGLGLRLLDVEKRLWNDHWVNAQSGVVGVPGLQGGFEAGVGLFPSTYDENGTTLHSMGIWDRIAPGQCRWRQVYSADGGRSWQHDWVMHWRRQT
jgi:hypothetical protein